jgi:hypothetical protein
VPALPRVATRSKGVPENLIMIERKTPDRRERDPPSVARVVPGFRLPTPTADQKDHRGGRMPGVAIGSRVDSDESVGSSPKAGLFE